MAGRAFPKTLVSDFRNRWRGLSEMGGQTLAKYAVKDGCVTLGLWRRIKFGSCYTRITKAMVLIKV
jgi:hypothetical protein